MEIEYLKNSELFTSVPTIFVQDCSLILHGTSHAFGQPSPDRGSTVDSQWFTLTVWEFCSKKQLRHYGDALT